MSLPTPAVPRSMAMFFAASIAACCKATPAAGGTRRAKTTRVAARQPAGPGGPQAFSGSPATPSWGRVIQARGPRAFSGNPTTPLQRVLPNQRGRARVSGRAVAVKRLGTLSTVRSYHKLRQAARRAVVPENPLAFPTESATLRG